MLSEAERYQSEIRQLEQNLQELQDMFFDLNEIINEQDEMIDQIQYNVETAPMYVEQGMTHLPPVAQVYHRRRCIIF
jgi:t-SNARE complex subunit (syntaxin)